MEKISELGEHAVTERKSQGVWNTAIQGACVLQRQRRKAETATAKPKGSRETTGEAAFCRKAEP